jgi:hypothetical protein
VPAKELQEAAKGMSAASGAAIRVFADGDLGGFQVGALAERLSEVEGRVATFEGELVAVLVGRPQTEVRQAVSAAGHRLAWARIRDALKQDCRVLPLRGEADEEEARLHACTQPEYEGVAKPPLTFGLLYEGEEVQLAYRALLGESEGAGAVCIVVTDRRLGRWDAKAGRWTAQDVLAGSPIVVSVRIEKVSPGVDVLVKEIRQALG